MDNTVAPIVLVALEDHPHARLEDLDLHWTGAHRMIEVREAGRVYGAVIVRRKGHGQQRVARFQLDRDPVLAVGLDFLQVFP